MLARLMPHREAGPEDAANVRSPLGAVARSLSPHRAGRVGFRIVLAHSERVEGLIVQNALAHNQGLGANWKTGRASWADRRA